MAFLSLRKLSESRLTILKNGTSLLLIRLLLIKKLKIIPRGKYVVQRGDSLWKIAEQTGTSVSKNKKLNGLIEDKIQVGALLKVNN
ncbi:LysM peptidoglycan-binding domain-containing protein [Anaerobacillus sp. HL2]|nr:LysM peptidoglycan-binding domain-containing protein [Anaerobacillus sp. HL2]